MVATLVVGAVVLAIGLAAALSHASVRRTGTDDVVITAIVGRLHGAHRLCQGEERIPAGTAGLRMALVPGSEPHAAISASVGTEAGTVATASDVRWDGDSIVATLRPRIRSDVAGQVCAQIRTRTRGGEVGVFGRPAEAPLSATADGVPIQGRMRVEYLQPRAESWWAFAPTVIRRIGLGHAWTGSSTALAAAFLMAISILLAAWLLVRPS